MNEEEKLVEIKKTLEELPYYEKYVASSPSTVASLLRMDFDRFGNFKNMKMRSPALIQVKVKSAGESDDFPIEIITLRDKNGEEVFTLECPYCTLLNMLDEFLEDKQSNRCELNEEVEYIYFASLSRLFKKLIAKKLYVNDAEVLLDFLYEGFTPRLEPTEYDLAMLRGEQYTPRLDINEAEASEFLYEGFIPRHDLVEKDLITLRESMIDADYFVRSLADILFYAYMKAPFKESPRKDGKYMRKHGIFKRCECEVRKERCKKLYLSFDDRNKTCYFPCFDKEASVGHTCRKAMSYRTEYEKKACRDLYKTLYNRLQKRDFAEWKAFQEEYKEERKRYANDLMRREYIKKWLQERVDGDYLRYPKK